MGGVEWFKEGKQTFIKSWSTQKLRVGSFLSSRQQSLVTHCVCVSVCVTAGQAGGGEEGRGRGGGACTAVRGGI